MTLAGIAWRNLQARPSRSALTLIGIALSVAAVVALTALAWGFEASWQRAAEVRGTDAVVTRTASQNALPSPFDARVADTVRTLPQVYEVAGLLSELMSVDDAPPMFVFGWQADSFLWRHLKLISGRFPIENGHAEVALGRLAADMLGKHVGATVYIDAEPFALVGIFDSPALVETGAALMTLTQMQRITDHLNRVNLINVRLNDASDETTLTQFRAAVAQALPGYLAITSGDLVQQNVMVRLARAMSWAVTVLAVLIGGAGVFNTMLMSVFERTREIAILLAVGWRRDRVIRMILLESLVLGLAGGVIGVVLGSLAVEVLLWSDMIRGRIDAQITAGLVWYALGVALALGLVGGVYPAVRASGLKPASALHAE
ncbi:FtsX-like permease family protein [Sinimarinibacterium sp. CAU 1509]|uniref:ABC transporter permease n=1 Tax=Sinimarinibacterium sp. CAU 1509 TaxID=2562283 RepID=UPI0010ABB4B4|nr:ABC transporter permease [Sinimarinibacterium sp. CAU 1509]TJY58270.1 FtsX-like permease family protein [Sinimarinibacterium sp. CAU 1509]